MTLSKYRPAPFLGKYDTIVFDLDGVITSEQRYWDAAALTVYQLITEPFNVKYADSNVSLIRTIIFYNDRIISLLKDLGVNSNWDLVYVVYAFMQILDTYDSVMVYNEIKRLNLNALSMYEYIENKLNFKREGDAYKYMVKIFQEWYLGDKLYSEIYQDAPSVYGKSGLYTEETPLLDRQKTVDVIKALSQYKTLGTATGRMFDEAAPPLKSWGVFDCFSPLHFATYTDILNAEKLTGNGPYTKPHPFLFTVGGIGKETSYVDILAGNFDKNKLKKVLAVGDAGADLMSAKAAGIDFAAVLTGVSGQKTRAYFESNNADYILDNIFGLTEEE